MKSLQRWIHEPWAINTAQIVGYFMAGVAGGLAALGAIPTILTANIGSVLSVAVGVTLLIGGIIGSAAVLSGHWWLERVALSICAVGWFALLPVSVYYALTGRSTVWLIVALVIVALCDIFKRYRRIDWAYLNPAK
jgi:uncharacterized membrane protein YhfC